MAPPSTLLLATDPNPMPDPSPASSSADRPAIAPWLPWLMIFLGVAGFIASGIALAYRVHNDNVAKDRKYWVFRAVGETEFTYAGRRVTLAEIGDGRGPDDAVLVTFGEEQLRLRVQIPPQQPIPGLLKHADWLTVLRFFDATGLKDQEIEQAFGDEGRTDRLVVVTRNLPPGINPETFGKVLKTDWTFDLYELLPDGTFHKEHFQYPSREKRPQELQVGTWQYDAALHLMPRSGPTHQFIDSPVRSTGWLLPAAAAACVLAMLGIVLVAINRKSSLTTP